MMLIYLLLMALFTPPCTARVVDCIKGEKSCTGSTTKIVIGGVHMCCRRVSHFSIVNNDCKCVEGLFKVGGSSFLSSILGPRRRTGTRLISRVFSSSLPGRSHSRSVHVTTHGHSGFGSDPAEWWKKAADTLTNFTRDMVSWTEGLNHLWSNMTFPTFRLATLNPDLRQGSSGRRVKVVPMSGGTQQPPSPPLTPPPSPRPPEPAPTGRPFVGRRPIDP